MMAENFANEYQTTLNGAVDDSQTSVVVTSDTGSPDANFRIRIDNEYMIVTAKSGTTFTVTRAAEGSAAAAHSSGATVTHILTAGGLRQALEEVMMGYFGTGSGATLVGTDSTSGASPLTLNVPAGIQAGDFCLFVVKTTNSVPNINGPDNTGWTTLYRFDTSTSEFTAVYYKIAGTEGSTWTLTHSAGSETAAGVAVFRGVNALWHSAYSRSTTTAPSAIGHPYGLQVNIWTRTTGSNYSWWLDGAAVSEDVNVAYGSGNTPQVMISHKEVTSEIGVIQLSVSGTATSYSTAYTIILYDDGT